MTKLKKEITDDLRQKTLNELKNVCLSCQNCILGRTRTNLVFSDGNCNAKLMLIGEAPGHDEDMTGIPFVGRAGKLLNVFFEKTGIDRQKDIYIANTVKCRPPENRVPTNSEKENCKRFLDIQINLVKPKVIILCGGTSVASFLGEDKKISRVRGQIFPAPAYDFETVFIPIFHPSYLLRNQSEEKGSPRDLMLEDLKLIKSKI